MKKTPNKIKKRNPTLLLFMVVLAVVFVLIDYQLLQYKWRPETRNALITYSLSAHFFTIGSFIYLMVYTSSHMINKVSKIIVICTLLLSTLVLGMFMLAVILLGSIRPEITLKPEGYNHVYYLYPQRNLFTRRGYGVYVPDSDYTMLYYSGDVAMDFDTSFVLDNNYYIKFDGMDRLLRSESDHLYKFDLSEPQY
ncbi:MAG: hypothetical protein ACI8ZM_004746 [Crocinitomix sp.]|jgi:hypothetical protein